MPDSIGLSNSEEEKMEAKNCACHTGVLIIVLALIGAAFYWFEYRPAEIRKACMEETTGVVQKLLAQKSELFQSAYNGEKQTPEIKYMKGAVEKGFYNHDDFEAEYLECLRSKGLDA